MTAKTPQFPDDKTAPARRKDLSDDEIKDLELAGGTEGGMQAGSAGGPGQDKQDGGKDAATPRRERKA